VSGMAHAAPGQNPLDRMGHARHSLLVAEVAHIDIHSGARLVGLGIVNQQDLELVGQLHNPILSVVEGGGFETIREPHYGAAVLLSQVTVEGSRLGLGSRSHSEGSCVP